MNLTSRINGKKTQTHRIVTAMHIYIVAAMKDNSAI